jgi:hypothetical protein
MNKINQGIILFKMNRSLLSDYFIENQIKTEFRDNSSWVILSPIEQSIKRKIEEIGTPLKDWNVNIYRGILTGYNEAFIISGEKRTELLAACGTEKERIRTDELIRPILRGRDIKRYNYEFADLWLINTHNGIKEKGISRIDIGDYPTIKAHLDQYWDQISTRADKGDTPYNLRNCAYMDDFSKQKILWKRVGSILRFCYDDTGCMGLDSTCFAIGNHVRYLLAVLNSPIGHYQLQNSPQTGTGDLLISVQALEPIYIPIPDEKLEKNVVTLINEIVISHNNKTIHIVEERINKLIFTAYHLTEEEISFIKESTRNISSSVKP